MTRSTIVMSFRKERSMMMNNLMRKIRLERL